jgi:hypothetical protein
MPDAAPAPAACDDAADARVQRPAASCAFCGGGAAGAGHRLGRLEGPFNASVKGYEAVYVHHECALWSPQVCVANTRRTIRGGGWGVCGGGGGDGCRSDHVVVLRGRQPALMHVHARLGWHFVAVPDSSCRTAWLQGQQGSN